MYVSPLGYSLLYSIEEEAYIVVDRYACAQSTYYFDLILFDPSNYKEFIYTVCIEDDVGQQADEDRTASIVPIDIIRKLLSENHPEWIREDLKRLGFTLQKLLPKNYKG